MFGSKKSSKSSRGVETLIARNTAIEGRVSFTGMLTIEGRVDGDVMSTEEKDSIVRVTADGKVQGEIRAPDVIINGHVQGDVFASGQLVLASDAIVDGNVHYNLIEMEKGAQINGKMVHSVPSAADKAASKAAKRVKPDNVIEPQKMAAG